MNATHTISPYAHSDVGFAAPQTEQRQVEAARVHEEPVDLLPARGVLTAVVLGAALWALIIATGWLIFR